MSMCGYCCLGRMKSGRCERCGRQWGLANDDRGLRTTNWAFERANRPALPWGGPLSESLERAPEFTQTAQHEGARRDRQLADAIAVFLGTPELTSLHYVDAR